MVVDLYRDYFKGFNMELGVLQNLELLPEILELQKKNAERLAKLLPPLTTKKEVARFLNVTPRTVNNYMRQGYLKEGYHYFHKNAKMIVFDEDAILEFRDQLSRGLINEEVAI